MNEIDKYLILQQQERIKANGFAEIPLPDSDMTIRCKPVLKSKEQAHIMKLRNDGDDIGLCAYAVVYCAVDEDGKQLFPASRAKTIVDEWGVDVVGELAGKMIEHTTKCSEAAGQTEKN